MKRFSEYQREVWEEGAAPSVRSGMTGASGPFGNSQAILHSGPPSLYKAGSAYAGSAAGSEYGQPLGGGDYYQNTNVLARPAHSRQASGAALSQMGGMGGRRIAGVYGTPSMYGMPGMGSMYACRARRRRCTACLPW